METPKFIKDENGNWIENPVKTQNTPVLRDAAGNIVEGAVLKEEGDKTVELEKIKEENKKGLEDLKKEETETVNVNKKALNDLLFRLERLESSADVGRLGKFDEKNKKDLPKVVLLGKYDGKIVLGWKMLKDEVQKINGVWRELQLIRIKLEDDTIRDLPYLQYIQEVVKVDATILSRTKDSDGHETLKVRRNDNGQEYSV